MAFTRPAAVAGPATPALDAAREAIRRISLENISTLARGGLGDPDIIPLWFGEGDLPAPAFIGEAMARAVEAGHVFYTYQNGIPELRQSIADYQTVLGARAIAAKQVTVTTSGMHAFSLIMQLVAGPGDNVIVIDPMWPNLATAARLSGAEARSVRMECGADGWTLDIDRLAAAMDARTRLVVFASPGNPTGAMIPIETQAQILALCRARGVWLAADEVYNRIVFDRRNAPTILDYAEAEDRLVVVNSFSKSWAMTGWRLGWMIHPPSIGATLAMMIQHTTSGVATFIQHAGVAAITQGEPFVAHIRDYCRDGMAIVCDALESFGRVRMGPRPTAGMFALFEVDGMADSREACLRLLKETKVGLAPGAFFGPGSETLLRVCICRSPASLREAMERLAPALG